MLSGALVPRMADTAERPALAEAQEEERRVVRQAQDEMARARPRASAVALITLALLAIFYTLYFAGDILLPCLFAVVLNLLLAPINELLTDRLRLPSVLSALLLIAALFGVIMVIGLAISLPAASWISKAPQSLQQLREKLHALGSGIDFLQHGIGQVEHLLQPPPSPAQPTVTVQQPSQVGSVSISILLGTRAALSEVFILVVVLYFLLVDGDSLLRRTVEILPTFGEKRRVVEIATEIRQTISGYLLTITAMNLLVGTANGLSIWLLGLPNPLLWGTVAFLLNYIPILGPLTGVVIFFFVGLFSTPTLWRAAAPALIYLAVHLAEGETITPMLLARRFTLNPVLVIVSLFFWDWMWGIAGAFLAVPLLAIAKTVADHIPALTPLGHLIGGPPRGLIRRA
jgi:predicted PurR-regulated permease PerM